MNTRAIGSPHSPPDSNLTFWLPTRLVEGESRISDGLSHWPLSGGG
jgi:hypothetical protein